MASGIFVGLPKRMVTVNIDGEDVQVTEGTTILEACRGLNIDTPTLCQLENLTPVNVCRVCVVEVEGSRVLVPACSRKVEADMKVHTDSERVQHSRRMVLEMLASSVDMSLCGPQVGGWMSQYGAEPQRFGPGAATMAQPVKIDNDLYVRDYSRCILCYKCVEACGVDAQNTFAIGVAGRGFDAHISTEFTVEL
ncbi:MAG TPA: 2Fe-2S iron-sulfur cluster-binding protein, partial [Candidatus Dormibacteraeota bacterium]